ncbi:MAG TPA: hypothetical protein VHG92_11150 [Afifellaceae bacterium]|nr:hypothetical protein [Afifellaceae bacterium]
MKSFAWATALVVTGMLAGCAEYLERRESISFGAGNAQQANLITHVVSPLPSHAADRDLWFHGERMGDAVERYRTGDTADPGAAAGPATTTDVPNGGTSQ